MAGCTTTPITVGRTLAAAQDLVATAGKAADAAYKSGAITKAQVAVASGLVDKADDVSLTARCAYAANNLTATSGALTALAELAAAVTDAAAGKAPAPVTLPTPIKCAAPAPVGAVVAP